MGSDQSIQSMLKSPENSLQNVLQFFFINKVFLLIIEKSPGCLWGAWHVHREVGHCSSGELMAEAAIDYHVGEDGDEDNGDEDEDDQSHSFRMVSVRT